MIVGTTPPLFHSPMDASRLSQIIPQPHWSYGGMQLCNLGSTQWLEYNPWKLLPFYMGENGWLLITRIDVHTLGHGNCKASISSRISYDTSLSCLIVNTLKFPTIVFLRLFHRFEPPAQGLEPFLRQSSQHPSPEICCCQGLLMPQRVVASEVNFSGSMKSTFLRICRVFSRESKQTISTKRKKHWLVFVVYKETSRNMFSLYIASYVTNLHDAYHQNWSCISRQAGNKQSNLPTLQPQGTGKWPNICCSTQEQWNCDQRRPHTKKHGQLDVAGNFQTLLASDQVTVFVMRKQSQNQVHCLSCQCSWYSS